MKKKIKPFSKQIIKDYCKSPYHCPYCNSRDIGVDDYNEGFNDISCDDCNESWTEIFVVTHLIKAGEGVSHETNL